MRHTHRPMAAPPPARASGGDGKPQQPVVERHEGGGSRFREIGIPFRRLFYTLDDGSLHPDEQVLARLAAGG